MNINYKIDKHHVCFPTKVLSTRVGHTFNVVLTENVDNGTVLGLGDYVSFDQYKQAAAPDGYEGIILEKAADDWGWYVQVTKVNANAPAVLVREVPVTKYNYNEDFADEANLYNAKGKTVVAYQLAPYDVYELSADAFTGTPVAGKKVTINGQKHVVGA